ncbi:MAG: hypothetical protein NZ743_07695, partial [Pseudomonadales bacterium]|nr:hypothetical protein [Pseudomonadales bacterium]
MTYNQRSELFNLDSVVFPSANYWLESMLGSHEASAVGHFVFSHSIAGNIVIELPTRENKDSSSRSLFL